MTLPNKRSILFANTHLHHLQEENLIQEKEADHLCYWLDSLASPDDTIIITGDFNVEPTQ